MQWLGVLCKGDKWLKIFSHVVFRNVLKGTAQIDSNAISKFLLLNFPKGNVLCEARHTRMLTNFCSESVDRLTVGGDRQSTVNCWSGADQWSTVNCWSGADQQSTVNCWSGVDQWSTVNCWSGADQQSTLLIPPRSTVDSVDHWLGADQ